MVASAFSADRTFGLSFHVSPRPGCDAVEATRANSATYGPYRLLSDADGSSGRICLTDGVRFLYLSSASYPPVEVLHKLAGRCQFPADAAWKTTLHGDV